MKKWIVIIMFLVITVSGYMYFNAYIKKMMQPMDIESSEYISLEIPSGSTTEDIAKILKNHGLIRSGFVFKYQSKKHHYDGKYRTGTYKLGFNMSMDKIMSLIQEGKAEKNTTRFTIPEGYDITRVADILAQKGLVDRERFLDVAANVDFSYKFLQGLSKEEGRLEGFLFPDTYEVFNNVTEEEIIDKMLTRFDELFTDEYYKRLDELNYTIKEMVTLASIIERETLLNKERPIVSSVFHNRLNTGMPLQSCATVQYVLGEVKPKLSIADTKIESPYNTYLHKGLPPGPIASPGLASIKAALYPDVTEYMYFVAKGDGSHAFAVTYNKFLNYKKKYR